MGSNQKYIPFLDGFRGYAILLVILGHLNRDSFLYLAQFGVTLFFFVSGFLITKLLIAEHNTTNTIGLKDFYLRRFFRLYPALIFYLIVTLAAVWIGKYQLVILDMIAGLFYFTNYYIAYFTPVVPDNYPLTASILWSLSVEEHFYLVFPLLFLLGYRPTSKKFLYYLGASLVVFLMIRIVLGLRSTDYAFTIRETYYTTHTRADSILYGCVAALLLYAYNTTLVAKWYLSVLRSRVIPLVAAVILLVVQKYDAAWYQIIVKYSLAGFLLCLTVPSLLYVEGRNWISRIFTNPVILYIGKLSYSLYLFHWVSFKFVATFYEERTVTWYFLVLALTFTLSAVSYHFVERPFLSLRRKFGSHAK